MTADDTGWGEFKRLEQENEEFRTALEFYADPHNWKRDYVGETYAKSLAMRDEGALARKRLGIPEPGDDTKFPVDLDD